MHSNEKIVKEQFHQVLERYSNLSLTQVHNNSWLVQGLLHFDASYKNESIEDKFEILLYISKTYPNEPPKAKEIGGRIPSDFHHYSNGTLCLGTPYEISMKFMKNPTLLGFIEEQLIPYLYSFSYMANHQGRMPFGERKHDGLGIIEYYKNLLNIKSSNVVLGFLRILADDVVKGHLICPCGSGSKLRQCHGKQLYEIQSIPNKDVFLIEYKHVYEYLYRIGIEIPRAIQSKRYLKIKDKKKSELDKSSSKR